MCYDSDMNTNRRTQTQKAPRSGADHDARKRALRAAATPRPSGNDYRRKPKHTGRGWSDD